MKHEDVCLLSVEVVTKVARLMQWHFVLQAFCTEAHENAPAFPIFRWYNSRPGSTAAK